MLRLMNNNHKLNFNCRQILCAILFNYHRTWVNHRLTSIFLHRAQLRLERQERKSKIRQRLQRRRVRHRHRHGYRGRNWVFRTGNAKHQIITTITLKIHTWNGCSRKITNKCRLARRRRKRKNKNDFIYSFVSCFQF